MRTIDQSKVLRLKEAVFVITRDEGVASASIAKIAKMAGLSPATAYVYYQDKTDMLSQIYLEVKQLMDEGLADEINQASTIKDKIVTSLRHFANRFVEYPMEANFMRAIQANPEFISTAAMQESLLLVKPLQDLHQQAVEAGVLVEDNQEIIVALTFAPIFMYIETRFQNKQETTTEEIERIIELSVNRLIAE